VTRECAELDAACFHLYGLDRDDTDSIRGTFPSSTAMASPPTARSA
jgi:hypothetical protein